jgi:hypothetical protein
MAQARVAPHVVSGMVPISQMQAFPILAVAGPSSHPCCAGEGVTLERPEPFGRAYGQWAHTSRTSAMGPM